MEGEVIAAGPGTRGDDGKLQCSMSKSATECCSESGREPRSKSTAKISSSQRKATSWAWSKRLRRAEDCVREETMAAKEIRFHGGPLHSPPRKEAVEPAVAAAPARSGCQVGEALADRRRRRRRRGVGHLGRQQAARWSQSGRCQGARLWRSSQGDARGHGDPDRRPGDQ